MTTAQLKVTFVGPLVSLQDAGRTGGLRYGVSPSGPMDRSAFAAAHAALGNPAGGTAVEISLGGLQVTCSGAPVTVAVTGGDFSLDHGGSRMSGWQVLTLSPGETLTLRAGDAGSWAYLAAAGQIAARPWMGSTAQHSKSGLGPGEIKAGDVLNVEQAEVRETRLGALTPPPATDGPYRVVLGPQDQYFEPASLSEFTQQAFTVGTGYDRMGMRLEGVPLQLSGALSIPSEPILRGAVQVSGDGVPTVLLADHQSTGGYPKVATVISPDTDRLAQLRSGEVVQFKVVTAAQAVELVRAEAKKRQGYLADLNVARGTLEERLMRENLIQGPVDYE